jgi:hypothetical protein
LPPFSFAAFYALEPKSPSEGTTMIRLTDAELVLLAQVPKDFLEMRDKDQRELWALKEKRVVLSRQRPLGKTKQNGTNVVTEWRRTADGKRSATPPGVWILIAGGFVDACPRENRI